MIGLFRYIAGCSSLLLSCGAIGCAAHAESREIDLTVSHSSEAVEPSRSIDAKHLVPPFRIETTEGDVLDSSELVGQRPFMLVYFATWCGVCRATLPMVRFVLDRYDPDIEVYGVVMDDANTWHRVPAYLEKYDIDYELVRAERFPRFAAAYSPSGIVPAVTVVGKRGFLVHYQHGYSREHFPRLVEALASAEAQH